MQSIERKISDTLDKDRGISGMKREFKKNGILYLIVLPVIVYYFIFHYMPLYGLLMAFQDFSPRRGISGSDWVGLTHFINFFKSPDFSRVVTNTLRISLSCLVFEFPAPIIMAILINELNGKYFKRTSALYFACRNMRYDKNVCRAGRNYRQCFCENHG